MKKLNTVLQGCFVFASLALLATSCENDDNGGMEEPKF